MKKIFIAEVVPSINKGESAILWGMLDALNALEDVEITLCTNSIEADRTEYGDTVKLLADNAPSPDRLLEYIGLLVRHFLFIVLFSCVGKSVTKVMTAPLWQTYLTTDLIILGHDNRLVGRGPLSLLAVPLTARVLGKPSMIFCGTVGPFTNRLSRWSAKFVLDQVDWITLRESTSIDTLKALGVDIRKVTLAADPAFLMPPAGNQRIQEILIHEGIAQNKPIIGLTITRSMADRYAQVHRPDNMEAGCTDYMKLVARILDAAIVKFDAIILILNHSLGPGVKHNDRLASREIVSWVTHRERVFAIENDYKAPELKGLVAVCVLFIGHRTHSLIAALSQYVPVIAISSGITSSKTRGIVGNMLNLDEWTLDIETVSEAELLVTVEAAWEQRLSIQDHLQKRIPAVRESIKLAADKAHELMQAHNR